MPTSTWVHWRERAQCRDAPPDPGWYPETKTRHPAPEIQAVCDLCPVRAECLAEALRKRELGVWGGTTEWQRAKIRRGRSRAACPVCESPHVRRLPRVNQFERQTREVCMSCAVSWLVPAV